MLGPSGTKHLAEGLAHNTTLKRLNLTANAMGPLGLASLVDSMNGNLSLTQLALDNNHLGDGSTEKLVQLIEEHNLTHLSLWTNEISEKSENLL